MKRIKTLTALAVMSLAHVAVSQTVVVNHYNPSLPPLIWDGPLAYTDIPGSEMEVTIPAGTAVITWATTHDGGNYSRFRPVIGSEMPSEGLVQIWAAASGSVGTWATSTEGGTLTVKLQVTLASSADAFRLNAGEASLSWTLMVFPDQPPQDVPTVSTWGLIVLTLLFTIAGTIIFARRGATSMA